MNTNGYLPTLPQEPNILEQELDDIPSRLSYLFGQGFVEFGPDDFGENLNHEGGNLATALNHLSHSFHQESRSSSQEGTEEWDPQEGTSTNRRKRKTQSKNSIEESGAKLKRPNTKSNMTPEEKEKHKEYMREYMRKNWRKYQAGKKRIRCYTEEQKQIKREQQKQRWANYPAEKKKEILDKKREKRKAKYLEAKEQGIYNYVRKCANDPSVKFRNDLDKAKRFLKRKGIKPEDIPQKLEKEEVYKILEDYEKDKQEKKKSKRKEKPVKSSIATDEVIGKKRLLVLKIIRKKTNHSTEINSTSPQLPTYNSSIYEDDACTSKSTVNNAQQQNFDFVKLEPNDELSNNEDSNSSVLEEDGESDINTEENNKTKKLYTSNLQLNNESPSISSSTAIRKSNRVKVISLKELMQRKKISSLNDNGGESKMKQKEIEHITSSKVRLNPRKSQRNPNVFAPGPPSTSIDLAHLPSYRRQKKLVEITSKDQVSESGIIELD